MFSRLVRDESGMAMALAVFTVVIVGVMGAGLLVFVNTDLTSVVESNQGQKAFGFADSGAQIAKARLLTTNADFRSYDGVTNLSADPPNPESPWSCGVWDTATNRCTAAGRQLTNLDGNPDLDATVWIQYLKPSLSESDTSRPDYAPEPVPQTPSGQTNYPPGKDFFKVISWGREGNALRKVEAIYNTYDLGVPKAYYTRGSIRIDGGAGSIRNISLFAGESITNQGASAIAGVDLAYGDWNKPPYNTTARSAAPTCNTTLPDGTQVEGKCAGAGARVSVANKTPNRDFDASTTPKFILKSAPDAPQTSSEITFPFRAGLPDIEALRTAARIQNNYYERTSSIDVVSGTPGGSNVGWPANSLSNTVVFVKFDDISDVLTWKVGSSCSDNPVRGTLVVETGRFTTSPGRTPLRGAVVISSAGPGTEVYTDQGNTCMQSFAVATGDIRIGGNVSPATQERGNSPGSYGINLWSWRELYE